MLRKPASIILLFLLVVSALVLAHNVQPVKASGTIYIRADGSIDPPTAPISTVDNMTYTFTGNIINESIVVQRDNIVLDGAGYMLQGAGSGNGVYLSGRTNVTIKNTSIEGFGTGILLDSNSGITISGNNITNDNHYGILLESSSNNIISENNMTANNGSSIVLLSSSNNMISRNNISANNDSDAITFNSCSNNTISENNIANNCGGVFLANGCANNTILKNNIANNVCGIAIDFSSNDTISGNNITASIGWSDMPGIGIWAYNSSNEIISENNITANKDYGIWLEYSSDYNVISENNIANNPVGIVCTLSSSGNMIYHNNFIDNSQQVVIEDSGSINSWDDSYPSGGNYWRDYTGEDANSDGIGDTPYVLDGNNQDRYPLMGEWSSAPKITAVDPSQPIAFSMKQLLGIIGEGFVPESEVTLRIGSSYYNIKKDNTWFVDPSKIEIAVGLTEKGTWKAQVTNPGSIQSNEFSFQVRDFTIEDVRRVYALAFQYLKDVDKTLKMTAIAMAESNLTLAAAGDRYYVEPDFLGYCSWGLWQIYMPEHPELVNLGAPMDAPYYDTVKWLSDPNNNVKAAYEIWNQ